MRLLLAWAAALPAACSFAATDGSRFRCESAADCPGGASCRADGYCGPAEDGGPTGDGGVGEACGTTHALRDSFDSQDATDALFSCNQGPVVEQGALVVPLEAGRDAFGTCSARRWYLFHDSGVSVRVVGPGAAGSWTEALFRIDFPDGTGYRAVALNGLLWFDRLADGAASELYRADHDPNEHLYWRLAERGGEVVFATSRDGEVWEERASDDGLSPLPLYARPALEGWGDQVRTEAGEIRFDDLNQGRSARRCPVSSLVDAFDGDQLAGWWHVVGDDQCTVSIGAGGLSMETKASFSMCGVESRLGLDLEDDQAAVEVAVPGDGAPSLNFELSDPDGRTYRFHLHEVPLKIAVQLQAGSGEDEVVDTLYSPEAHRRWRFRHAGDSLFFETSGDGGAWIELHELKAVAAIEDVVVRLFAYNESADPDESQVGVDQLNAPP